MICRSCGAKIADKAIVCYRCGTPTADLPPVAPLRAGSTAPRWIVGLLTLILLVFAGMAWWLLPGPPTDGTHLALSAVVGLLIIFSVVRLLRPRR